MCRLPLEVSLRIDPGGNGKGYCSEARKKRWRPTTLWHADNPCATTVIVAPEVLERDYLKPTSVRSADDSGRRGIHTVLIWSHCFKWVDLGRTPRGREAGRGGHQHQQQ